MEQQFVNLLLQTDTMMYSSNFLKQQHTADSLSSYLLCAAALKNIPFKFFNRLL